MYPVPGRVLLIAGKNAFELVCPCSVPRRSVCRKVSYPREGKRRVLSRAASLPVLAVHAPGYLSGRSRGLDAASTAGSPIAVSNRACLLLAAHSARPRRRRSVPIGTAWGKLPSHRRVERVVQEQIPRVPASNRRSSRSGRDPARSAPRSACRSGACSHRCTHSRHPRSVGRAPPPPRR